jgi:hypothetical protein
MKPSMSSSWAKLSHPDRRRGDDAWSASPAAWQTDACEPGSHGVVPRAWDTDVQTPFGEIVATRMREAARIASIEGRLSALEENIEQLGAIPTCSTLYLSTFAPEPYTVKRPIPIAVQENSYGFFASFADANINSSGDTQQEAFANVRELILDVFDRLNSLPAKKLGPGPARQIAVLREFIDAATDHKRTRPEDHQEA